MKLWSMAPWMLLPCVILSQLGQLAAAETLPAEQKYHLLVHQEAGKSSQVEAQLEVGGDLRFNSGGNKVVTYPLSVNAQLTYDERVLSAPGTVPRAVRHYGQAEATIKIDAGGQQPKLRAERRLIVAQAQDEQVKLFSPQGPLTRDELDLIDVLGNTLTLDQLLPVEAVAVGDSWPIAEHAAQSLLGLSAIGRCELEAVLAKVEANVAEVMIDGSVQGAAEGVSTEIELKARLNFDLNVQQIVGATIAVKEKRAIGHVGPGLDVVAKLRLKITPGETPETLSDALLADLPLELTPEVARLEHESETGGFGFLCDRRWYLTSDEFSLVVLRLIERGDLVAQCNISPVTARAPERRISLGQYQIEVQHTLGKNFERILGAGEWTDELGHLVYRVVAEGNIEGLPIEWRYYLVHHPDGRRVAVAFTVESALSERLGEADRELVDTLLLLPTPEATAARAAAAQK